MLATDRLAEAVHFFAGLLTALGIEDALGGLLSGCLQFGHQVIGNRIGLRGLHAIHCPPGLRFSQGVRSKGSTSD